VNGPSARAGGLDDAARRLKVSAHIRTGNRSKTPDQRPATKARPESCPKSGFSKSKIPCRTGTSVHSHSDDHVTGERPGLGHCGL
jgi:hypothetical protein